jgi:MFS transporter, ACS family, D-galactonate transporter
MNDITTGTAEPSVTTAVMTNVRWRIFVLILGTVAINYIDRASLSVAMPMISREFSISPAIQGVLLSSFFWTYCFMQIPGGMLADRFLPRSVIAGATIGWGAFAALAAVSTGWITMLLPASGWASPRRRSIPPAPS